MEISSGSLRSATAPAQQLESAVTGLSMSKRCCALSSLNVLIVTLAQSAVIWRIRRFPGRHEYNLLAEA